MVAIVDSYPEVESYKSPSAACVLGPADQCAAIRAWNREEQQERGAVRFSILVDTRCAFIAVHSPPHGPATLIGGA
jgi:hypothetical protein